MRDRRGSGRDKRTYAKELSLAERQLRPTTDWYRGVKASTGSQDSDIPLERPGIKKTTDLSVTHEPRMPPYNSSGGLDFEGRRFLVEDRV